jgi:hypothetical protein
MKVKGLRIIIILVAIVIFNSFCQSNNIGKISLTEIENIEFNLGYAPMSRYSGTVELHGKEYLYFGDAMTNKCIDIVAYNTDTVCRIPLNEVIKKEEIEDFYIRNLDSIFVLSQYSNHLYLIDNKGSILKTAYFTQYLKPHGSYDLRSSAYQDFYFNGSFLFAGERHVEAPFEDDVKSLRYICGKMYASPHFFKFTNVFTDSAKLQTGLNGFYLKLVTSDSFLVESQFYYHIENKNRLFCFSAYSDKISEIDPDSLTIKRDITIKSKYTKVGCSPVPINEETLKDNNLISNTLQTQGGIARLFFDKYRQLFYVIVMHSVDGNAPKNNRGPYRAWSLFVYDSTFTNFSEIKMPPLKLDPFNIIVCKEGLLISTNFPMNKNYESNKAKFTLFKVSR